MRWQKIFIRKDCDVETFEGVILTATNEIWRIKKQKREFLFGRFLDKHFHYYSNGIDRWQIGRSIYKKRFNTIKQILKAYHDGKKLLKVTADKTAKWKITLRKPNQELLAAALRDFKKDFDLINYNYSISTWWALESWQHDFEKIVNNLTRHSKLKNRYEQIIESLLQPWKETAIRVAGQKLANGESIRKLAKEFQFLRSWTVIWYKPVTNAWIKSTAQNPNKQRLLSQTQLFRLLKPNKKQAEYIKLAPYVIFFKDWRDDLRRKQAYDWVFLFDSIANYFKVERNDLGYFSFEELFDALKKNRLDKSILKQRKGKEFIVTVKPGKLALNIINGVPLKYKHAIVEAETTGELAEARGIVAQPGIIRGQVRVVKNHHDVKKVEKNEILVSNTTHPDYLQAMKKAAAFVTDEGGIVSHAAIVAREFKKPCIVGTKIATKIFKDGDMVEVDANKGIVRKI